MSHWSLNDCSDCPCVKEILQGSPSEPPDDSRFRKLSLSALRELLSEKLRTWRTFGGDKKRFEQNTLVPLAQYISWREANKLKDRVARPLGPTSVASAGDARTSKAALPQAPRQLSVLRGRSHGAKMNQAALQGISSKAQRLVPRPANTLLAMQTAASASQPVDAARGQVPQHSRRCCVSCKKQVATEDVAMDEADLIMCNQCRDTQVSAMGAHCASQQQTRGERLQAAPLKSASAAGALDRVAGASGRFVPRSMSNKAFYSTEDGGRGLNLNAPLHSEHALLGSAPHTAQQQQALAESGRARRGQQPKQASAHRRSVSDAAEEDFELASRRTGGAAKQRGRRSAPVEPPEQEPIDLAESSDEEGAVDGDGDQRAKTGNAAGLGPSSAAAATVVAGAENDAGGRHSKFGRLSVRLAGLKCWFPAGGGKHSVEVAAEDLARLENGEFLNDTCIDFYIKYIELNLQEDIRSRYHFFNTFFLKKLQEKPGKGSKVAKADRLKQDHERVKKWTKHVDLFSKDYIFVPIHGFLHWSLVLICHPGNVVHQVDGLQAPASADSCGEQQAGAGAPLMLHLDSLDGNHAPKAIFEALRSYLEQEWKRKADDKTQQSVPRKWKECFAAAGQVAPEVRFTVATLPGISMSARLPKQDNHTDCGLFLLSYMDFFAAANPRCVVSEGSNAQDVHVLDPQPQAANAQTLLQKNWFRKSNAARLRDHMRALICKLMLERVSQEDERRSTLECVVDDYAKKPDELGQRYLQPVAYLSYVNSRPDEPEPVLDDDVLSSGSGVEEHMEHAQDVLQSPLRHMTRAAARQAGIKPTEGLPTPGPLTKRRKGAAPNGAGPTSQSADNDKSVVDLSSPDKVPDASQAAEHHATSEDLDVATALEDGEPPLTDPQPMEVDDEDEDVQLVGSVPGPERPADSPFNEGTCGWAKSEEEGAAEPPAKRPKRQATMATCDAAQRPTATRDDFATAATAEDPRGRASDDDKATAARPEAVVAPHVTSADEAGDEDGEPPKQQRPGTRRFLRSQRRRCWSISDTSAVAGDADGEIGDAAEAGAAGQLRQSLQADPETLSVQRVPGTAPSAAQAKAQGTARAGADPCQAPGESGAPEQGHAPRLSAGKSFRKIKRAVPGSEAIAPPSASGLVAGSGTSAGPTTRQSGRAQGPPGMSAGVAGRAAQLQASGAALPGSSAVACQRGLAPRSTRATGHGVEPPLDGLVPGDDADNDSDPLWLQEQSAKHCDSERGGISTPSSDDEGQPEDAPGPHNDCRVKRQVLRQERQHERGPAAALEPAGLGTEQLGPFRTHTRFADDDAEPVTERVPIRPDEAGEAALRGAGSSQPSVLSLVAYSSDNTESDGDAHVERRRCATGAQRSAAENAQLAVGAIGTPERQVAAAAAGAAGARCAANAAADSAGPAANQPGIVLAAPSAAVATGPQPGGSHRSELGRLAARAEAVAPHGTWRACQTVLQKRSTGNSKPRGASAVGAPVPPSCTTTQHPPLSAPRRFTGASAVDVSGCGPAAMGRSRFVRTPLAQQAATIGAGATAVPEATPLAGTASAGPLVSSATAAAARELACIATPREQQEDEDADPDISANLDYPLPHSHAPCAKPLGHAPVLDKPPPGSLQPTVLGCAADSARQQSFQDAQCNSDHHGGHRLHQADRHRHHHHHHHNHHHHNHHHHHHHRHHHDHHHQETNHGKGALGSVTRMLQTLPELLIQGQGSASNLPGRSGQAALHPAKGVEASQRSGGSPPRENGSHCTWSVGAQHRRLCPKDARGKGHELRQAGAKPMPADGPPQQPPGAKCKVAQNKLKAQVKDLMRMRLGTAAAGRRPVPGVPIRSPAAGSTGKGQAPHQQALELENGRSFPWPRSATGVGVDTSLGDASHPCQADSDGAPGAARKRRCVEWGSCQQYPADSDEGREPAVGQTLQQVKLLPIEGVAQNAPGLVATTTAGPGVEGPLTQQLREEHPQLRLELRDGDGSKDPPQHLSRQVSDGGTLSTDDEGEAPPSVGGATNAPNEPPPASPDQRRAALGAAIVESSGTASPLPQDPTGAQSRPAAVQWASSPDAPGVWVNTFFLLETVQGYALGAALVEGIAAPQVLAPQAPAMDPALGPPAAAADEPAPAHDADMRHERVVAEKQPATEQEPDAEMAAQDDEAHSAGSGGAGLPVQVAAPSAAGVHALVQGGSRAAGAAQSLARLKLDDGAASTELVLWHNHAAASQARRAGTAWGHSQAAAAVAAAAEKAAGAAVWPSARVTAVRGRADGSAGVAPREPDATVSSSGMYGSADSGRLSDCVIDVAEELDEEQAAGVPEEQRSSRSAGCGAADRLDEGLGTGAAMQASAGRPGPGGRAAENDAERIGDTDEPDSEDLVGPVEEADATNDSDDAFVAGADLGSRSSGRAGAKARGGVPPPARGKQAVQSQRQQRGGRGADAGRGRGGKRGGKPSSSTRGVTPSHGGGVATASRSGKQQQRGSLSGEIPPALAGGINAYCVRLQKPDFPRSSKAPDGDPSEKQAPNAAFDLTLEDE